MLYFVIDPCIRLKPLNNSCMPLVHKWACLTIVHLSNAHFEPAIFQGEVEEWTVHTTGLQGLRSKGLGRDALIEGETYTVSGVRAHSGRPEGFLAEITLLDGQLIQVWTGDPNGN